MIKNNSKSNTMKGNNRETEINFILNNNIKLYLIKYYLKIINDIKMMKVYKSNQKK